MLHVNNPEYFCKLFPANGNIINLFKEMSIILESYFYKT